MFCHGSFKYLYRVCSFFPIGPQSTYFVNGKVSIRWWKAILPFYTKNSGNLVFNKWATCPSSLPLPQKRRQRCENLSFSVMLKGRFCKLWWRHAYVYKYRNMRRTPTRAWGTRRRYTFKLGMGTATAIVQLSPTWWLACASRTSNCEYKRADHPICKVCLRSGVF